MIRELKMLMIMLKAAFKSSVMHRMDFIIGLIGTLFYNVVFIASIGIITSKFNAIGGFGMWEMLFLYGLFMLGHSLYTIFLINMTMLNRTVMEGSLDKYFLRPYGILIQMNGIKLNYDGLINTIIGIISMIVACRNLPLHFGIIEFALLPIFAICGAAIEYSLALAMNCLCFLFPNVTSLFGAYFQFVLIAQRYPLNIFGTGFQALLTFVFPLGFMNYYPSLLLLGKPGGYIAYFAPLAAIICVSLSYIVFRKSIKHYSSTGN